MTSERREARVVSRDGVEIVYSAVGAHQPALVFIHGGLANRTFWEPQVAAFGARRMVVAVDLAGHGDSGRNRREWSIPAFAEDVATVVSHLGLARVVLLGNSLGGPVALEAATLLPGIAVAVIGVDTFHDLTAVAPTDVMRTRAEAFGRDPEGSTRTMVTQLFHAGAYPDLQAWATAQMLKTPVSVVVPMLRSFGGYDPGRAARAAGVPVSAINGDLWPTTVGTNRTIVPGFDVSVVPNAGHYLMLETPEEFNAALERVLTRLGA